MDRFSSKLQSYVQKRKWNLRWHLIFLLFAFLVALIVIYALILPAVSLTEDSAPELSANESVFDESAFTEHATVFSYEDDTLSASVTLPEGTSVPTDAVLSITPVTEETDAYTKAAEQVASGDLQDVKLYDVSFYTADGTYLSVSDQAKVSIHFKETIPIETTQNVAVLHFEDTGTQLPTITDVQTQDENQMTDLSFDTEGFSIYAVVTWTESMDLDGESYAIVNINDGKAPVKHAALMATPHGDSKLEAGLLSGVTEVNGQYYVSSAEQKNFTEWHFTKQEDSGYYIWAGTEDSPQYIRISGNDRLYLSSEPQLLYLNADSTGTYPGQVRIHDKDGYAINWHGGGDPTYKVYFGTWNAKGALDQNDYFVLAKPVEDRALFFDVNAPVRISNKGHQTPNKLNVYSDSWWNNIVPTTNAFVSGDITQLNDQPDGYVEGLGAAGKLYQEKYGTDVANPYTKLYRFRIRDSYDFTSNWKSQHYLDGFDYYKEVQFQGWSYTDSSGIKHRFSPCEPVQYQTDSNSFLVTDQEGNTVSVPSGSTFVGEWELVSSPVEFFVNYGGTILDTEGDVALRDQKEFTKCIAVGTLLFGKSTVGTDTEFANNAHEKITAMITPSEDVDFERKESQIILEYLSDYSEEKHMPFYNLSYHSANFSMMQNCLLHLIRNDNSMNIRLSTGDGNVVINNQLATPENYQVRWYVLKDQDDGWHVDGVMTATTKEMTITKTFRNLNQSQVQQILSNGYEVDMKIGNGIYMYLKPDGDLDGQYTYSSSYDDATKTYTCIWNVRVLDGEQYVIQEKNYEYEKNDYHITASTMINNQPETQRMGDTAGRTSDTDDAKYNVVGGATRIVSIANLYSPISTATLTILKINADTGLTMKGVHFDLIPIKKDGTLDETQKIERITNANGYASFAGLKAGSTYQLKEVFYQNYFLPNENKMIVTVTRDENSDIPTITVTETNPNDPEHPKTYQNQDGESVLIYSVQNYLSPETAMISKNFENISSDAIQDILKNYQIVVKNDKTGAIVETLTKENAVRVSSDYKQLIWYVGSLTSGVSYTLTEEHYQSDNQAYQNVTVTAQKDIKISNSAEIPVEISGSGENKTASVTIEKGTEHNWIRFINTYANTYDLQLRKVDSVTGKPLQHAVFSLYGKHEESTDPSRWVRYTKSDGTTITLYYIKDAEETDENGYTTIQNLNFSNTSKSYIYILQESTAPEGYLSPTDITSEQVLEVTPNQIGNGVYSLSLKNTPKTESLVIQKTVSQALQDKDALYKITLQITDPTASEQALKKYPFSYQILEEDGTVSSTGTFEEGSTITCSLKANQQILLKQVPVGFLYTVAETVMDETGTVLYEPCISTNNHSIWSSTVTGTIQDSENRVAIKNYPTNQSDTMDLTVYKQWSDTGEHDAVTVHLYQMQMQEDGTIIETVLYPNGTVQLDSSNGWKYTWKNVPKKNAEKNRFYCYYIREETVDGYDCSYYNGTETNPSALLHLVDCTVGAETVQVVPVDLETGQVTILNSERPKLPNTGGSGTKQYEVFGFLLILSAAIGGWIKLQRQR